ncbi:hypothetical protein SAMN05877838_3123 [Hoeflea halophila]|uniref:Uncharacterized protein n=1 Tax=Hoeflea halophila TaxID=714899 RepID=A0A286IDK7_9HYPH|nr:DUF6492 family protein [Hoeflea halophila]SOE18205.1 hypothetical protein SAMN05877838_3123 [Hoeflea halophila]
MKTAVMTASWSADLDRCRLMCESLDRFLSGDWHHYLLVEPADVTLFSPLEGPRRTVVSEADLFPWWLRSFPDPLSLGRRRLWLSPFSVPLRGWHAQQIRRMALARHIDADMLLSVDSDVVMVRSYDPSRMWMDGNMVMYRVDAGVSQQMTEHRQWFAHAGKLLGVPAAAGPLPDYINTFIGWRADTARAMLDHIEKASGRDWVRALIGSRAISECTIYGRFVDEVLAGEGHSHSNQALCHVLWDREAHPETQEGLEAFMQDLKPGQVAIGIQSFVNHPISEIRRLAFSVAP